MTTVEPWEVAYFNGAALLDEIPVGNRDTHEQYALRDHSQTTQEVRARNKLPFLFSTEKLFSNEKN
jgi:hypothetical protein